MKNVLEFKMFDICSCVVVQLKFIFVLNRMGALFATPVDEGAILPYRQSAYQASYELCSNEDVTIPARMVKKIRTGIKLKLPVGTYGRISSHPAMLERHRLMAEGIHEPNETGEVMVRIINLEDIPFPIIQGDALALLTLNNYTNVPCLSALLLPSTNMEDWSRIHTNALNVEAERRRGQANDTQLFQDTSNADNIDHAS
jgi:dUTP pyrophosphatase